MKILVTGAAGFIGSYVSRALIWRGDDVLGIDNFNDYYPRNCKEFNVDLSRISAGAPPETFSPEEILPVYSAIKNFYPKVGNVTAGNFAFKEGDITDFEFLSNIFKEEKIDAVIHLAAMAGVPVSIKNPRLYTRVNVDGTVNLLELAKEHKLKKFVFGSSSTVYGNREDKKVDENDNVMTAASPYGATKVAGEVLCHAFNVVYGLPIVIDRIFGPIFGPLQRPFGMFIQRAINHTYLGKKITVYGKFGLDTAKDSTYIDDQVDGLLKCLDCDYNFEVFNIGTSNPQSINLWLAVIEKSIGVKPIVEVIQADKGDVVSSANISKAKTMLDYAPRVTVEEGIKRQVEIYRLMPDWYKTLENV